MHQDTETLDKTFDLVKQIFYELSPKDALFSPDWDKSPIYVIGVAIWDIFSNNHKVINADNRIHDLGSWRVSGDHIAEIIETEFKTEPFYDYMDFYKGSIYQLSKEVELQPIYQGIFEILKQNGCDWQYASPELFITQLNNGKPSESEGKTNPLMDSLKNSYDKLLEKQGKDPLQITIEAYIKIFDKLPSPIPKE